MSTLLTTVATIAALGLFVYGARGNSRNRAKARLRRRVQGIVTGELPCLHTPELLGVGNVGAVFAATLDGDWERQLGIQWRTQGPLPRRVAVKFAAFRDNTERLRALSELAPRLERRLATQPDFPLCPFLALGLWRQPKGRSYLVEVMPLVPGPNLDKLLLPGALPPESLGQLALILDTVLFLESEKYYTRNLDAENVLVSPEGRWVRIDFDNAKTVKNLSLLRMQRLCRLTRQVLEAQPLHQRGAAWAEVHRRAAATERAPLKEWHRRGVPSDRRDSLYLSCEELCEAVRELAAVQEGTEALAAVQTA